MIDFADLAIWAAGAVIAGGLIQWCKGLVTKAPRWVWAIASPVAALAAALASGSERWAWDWLGVWACSQLFYEVIIQAVKKRIGGYVDADKGTP